MILFYFHPEESRNAEYVPTPTVLDNPPLTMEKALYVALV